MNDLSVVVTGCGSAGAYGLIRCLRENGERSIRIIGLDTDPLVANRYFVDQFVSPPPRNNEEFIPFVTELVSREGVDIVYPVPTAELEPFAQARPAIENQGIRVIVSNMDALEIANNKSRLYAFITEAGYACAPLYATIRTWTELEQAAEAFGYPGDRICIKPPVSTGSRGLRILDASMDRLELLLYSFPTATFVRLEDLALTLQNADPFPELIVMEYIPGEEYDVDVLADNGKPLAIIPRRNERMWYGLSLVSVTEPHEEVMSATQEIVSALGLSFVISASFRISEAGTPKLTEINPRIPGSIIAAQRSGVNLPYLAIKAALGEKFDIPPIKWGTKMIRYWDDLFISPEGELLSESGGYNDPRQLV